MNFKFFKLRHVTLVALSGLIWLGVGCVLLPFGLNLIVDSTINPRHVVSTASPMLDVLSPLFGGVEQAALVVIAFALLLGYFKGRYVLGKSVRHGVERIMCFPNPTSVFNIYSLKYYCIFGSMIFLGIIIKVLQLPSDIRGAVDVVIGSALINGALLYFRYAFSIRNRASA